MPPRVYYDGSPFFSGAEATYGMGFTALSGVTDVLVSGLASGVFQVEVSAGPGAWEAATLAQFAEKGNGAYFFSFEVGGLNPGQLSVRVTASGGEFDEAQVHKLVRLRGGGWSV